MRLRLQFTRRRWNKEWNCNFLKRCRKWSVSKRCSFMCRVNWGNRVFLKTASVWRENIPLYRLIYGLPIDYFCTFRDCIRSLFSREALPRRQSKRNYWLIYATSETTWKLILVFPRLPCDGHHPAKGNLGPVSRRSRKVFAPGKQ